MLSDTSGEGAVQPVLRLNLTFDVQRLREDLETAERVGQRHMHFTANHDGGWSGIALVSIDGRTDAESIRYGTGHYRPTPVLEHCPYFRQILSEFRCPKHQVRLLRLEAGKRILEHRDRVLTWPLGIARLHIPIITHEEVYFYLDGRRVQMAPGELWYCDFSRPHSVENRSPIARVHLVMDLASSQSRDGDFWLMWIPRRMAWIGRIDDIRAFRYTKVSFAPRGKPCPSRRDASSLNL